MVGRHFGNLKTGDVVQELGTKAEVVWKVAFGEAEVENAVVASKQGAAFLDVSEPLIAFFGVLHVAKTDTGLVFLGLVSGRLEMKANSIIENFLRCIKLIDGAYARRRCQS